MRILAAMVLVKRVENFGIEQKKSPGFPGDFWSGLRDSNPRPSPWQGKDRDPQPLQKWLFRAKFGIFGEVLENPYSLFYPLLFSCRVLCCVHPRLKPGALGKRLRRFSPSGFPTAVEQSFYLSPIESAHHEEADHLAIRFAAIALPARSCPRPRGHYGRGRSQMVPTVVPALWRLSVEECPRRQIPLANTAGRLGIAGITEAAPGRMQYHTRRQAEGKRGAIRPLGAFSGGL